MAENLPLLIFPQPRRFEPPKGSGFPPRGPHVPIHTRQTERLKEQMEQVQKEFSKYKASVSGSVAGLEPEMVLVIKIVGVVDDFKRAVDHTEGLEWLGEWDIEDIEPDDNFYENPKIGVGFFTDKIDGITTREQSKAIRQILLEQKLIDEDGILIDEQISQLSLPEHFADHAEEIINAINQAKYTKLLKGRLFLSMSNEQGLRSLLNLWQQWSKQKILPRGQAKWRDVFKQTMNIRRWGMEETLHETGMIDRWHDLLDPVNLEEEIHCQIELFYSSSREKRKQNEKVISRLLKEAGGGILYSTDFIDMPEIAFHAVKVKLPTERVRHLLETLDSSDNEVDIELFKFPGIMYFRPTGQSLVALNDDGDAGETVEFPQGQPEVRPVVAILDGVPNLQHDALRNRLLLDDPDNLSSKYQPGERKHGTAMASLVVHGELDINQDRSLTRKVYHAAVMQPDPSNRDHEYIPDDVFFEDRIERAVRRMFEGEGNAPAQAPNVKIINLSICDPERPFIHTPSPWARLLDWLSWKYRVLLCVSAGNFTDGFDIDIPHQKFAELPEDQKTRHVLKLIEGQLSQRRLLSPAESLNALTVGALHADHSSDYKLGNRIDLLPDTNLFSPISRFGHGFRSSVKPEIMFPGGRQLYYDSPVNEYYRLETTVNAPGQKVACDSPQQGRTSRCVHTRGTSNSAALASRGGARIYEVLSELRAEHGEQIDEGLIAVLIKALLIHGAKHSEQAKSHLTRALKNPGNSRRFKKIISRYMGYGAVDIDRVLTCTEQRATVLGSGEIQENEVHEYRFPLPVGLSGSREWRCMVVTLAWFSPINPAHRNLREAKLSLSPSSNWGQVPLEITRKDSDHNQVLLGTVQHEVFEGKRQVKAFQDGDEIKLRVMCKKDATEELVQAIPYGLAVTLEVEEGINIPIYQQIRDRIRPQVVVGAVVETE